MISRITRLGGLACAMTTVLLLVPGATARGDLANVPLTADVAHSTVGHPDHGGWLIADTLTDPWPYDPNDPDATWPDTYTWGEGFHANGDNPVFLYYELSEITFVTGNRFVFDAWGRSVEVNRDDDFDVALLSGGYNGTVVAEVLNTGIYATTLHARIDLTPELTAGEAFDTIRLTGRHAAWFTIMEVRAAYDNVPEPASLAMLALAGLALLRRRRRA